MDKINYIVSQCSVVWCSVQGTNESGFLGTGTKPEQYNNAAGNENEDSGGGGSQGVFENENGTQR